MKVSRKAIISFIILSLFIAVVVIAGHYNIQKDKMEAFINRSYYMKFVNFFLYYNEALYDQFKPIFEEKRIKMSELALINQAAREIVEFTDEITDYYNAFYGESNEPGQYIDLIHSVFAAIWLF